MHEFAIHFRGAVRNGLSDGELQAALVQVAVYCGVPAGVEAFRVARQVREEMAGEGAGT
jgi:4-carboxymuconolactone decarboxylase